MNSKLNKDLTPEQHHILREEGTEPPGSSPLNQEKREGDYHCVGCGPNCLVLLQNMKADLDGHLSFHLYLVFLKQKPICILDMQEQNIIVKNAEVTMVIYLMMGPNQQEKDFVTMVFV